MKNNALFLAVMIALLVIGLGALYYQYQAGEFETSRLEMAAEPTPSQEVVISPEPEPQVTEPADPSQDDLIESMPEVSDDMDLETIQQELEETRIPEEDFSDLQE